MMREIKFRAYYNGEFIYWERGDKSNWFWDVVRENGLDVEQYTGLKDKNGVEIYDGDIAKRKVERSDYYPEQIWPKVPEHKETKRWVETQTGKITMTPEIRFNNELLCGCRKLLKEEEIKENQIVSGWDYEVIGTIHNKAIKP